MAANLLLLSSPILLIGLGLAHGHLTGRWGGNDELTAATQRLEQIPASLGNWTVRPLELDPRQARIGEIAGHVTRRYENPATGAAFTVILVCGRPGPISVHTPDVCYRENGYAPTSGITPHSIDLASPRSPAVFLTGRFDKQEAGLKSRLRIWWAWNADGLWQAPKNPRMTFAGRSYLCKLYVVHELTTDELKLEESPSREFIKELLPEIEGVMWPVPGADSHE